MKTQSQTNPRGFTLRALKSSTPATTRLLLACLLLLLPAPTRAETGVQAWVQRYNGPTNGYHVAYAIAVDGSNNVIVTGISDNDSSQSNPDYLTIKYSGAGVPLWTNRYDGPGNDYDLACAVAVDSNNNVIVTGYSTNSTSGYDYATIKYSSAGEPLWTNRYDGPGNGYDYASSVAVDRSNNVIVAGTSASSSDVDYPNLDYATIKYSSDGVPFWTNRYDGPQNYDDQACALVVDGSNNVIVTGFSTSTNDYPYNSDYVTIKYSSDGVALWTNRYNGPGNDTDDMAFKVAVDGSNNVIVTGSSTASGSAEDCVTIKYSSAGVPLWTNRYNGGGFNNRVCAMVIDGSDNVIVTGYSTGLNLYDYATIKYSSTGVPLWTNRYDGPMNGHDYAFSVAVDRSNNVIVTGSSWGSADDYATIKYSSVGVPLWTQRYNGPGNGWDSANAVVVDGSGNVIVTGLSAGGTSYEFATIKYICVPEPVLTNLVGSSSTFQMRVDGVLQPGTLVIEASTNLTGWTPVFTNTTPTNVLFYTDPDAGSFPTRFYRAFQFP